MDEVHTLRDQFQADICVLFNRNTESNICGKARLSADESSAFALVNYDCDIALYSFPHEIGHLIGLDHNNAFVKKMAIL